ncbi:MAG TPA: hypothetical protein VFH29_10250 [Anaerolineales bacterium]|nr:hypothetical protein [Anaerolineales bacterium]
MRKFAVITTIFEPSLAVRKVAELDDWEIVVVGDKKTPEGWASPRATYLSPTMQDQLPWSMSRVLPWNHYSRKMLGYAHAIQEGADLIADLDDDNIPLANWGELPPDGSHETVVESGFLNAYKFFTDAFIWPRGFPIDQIRSERRDELTRLSRNVGVWQFLANNEADVDAIYRLLFDRPITFSQRQPIVLEEGVFCPCNSQNTLFVREAFVLLYLPAFVSFRFTDVLRGLVAQPILWAADLRLGFGPATTLQQRNPHTHLKDFEAEITTYLYAEKAAYLAAEAVNSSRSMADNLVMAYESLLKAGIVEDRELPVLEAWLKDVVPLLKPKSK